MARNGVIAAVQGDERRISFDTNYRHDTLPPLLPNFAILALAIDFLGIACIATFSVLTLISNLNSFWRSLQHAVALALLVSKYFTLMQLRNNAVDFRRGIFFECGQLSHSFSELQWPV